MILDLKVLGSAVAKVDKLSADNTKSRQVLFDVNDNEIYFVYSDGKKSIVEKLEAELEDADINERAIVDIAKIKDVLESCSSRGMLRCDEVHIHFDGKDQMTASAVKYMLRERDGMELKKVDSRISKKFKYLRADSLKNGSLLTRFNYKGLFEAMNGEFTFDEWENANLREMLARTSRVDKAPAFISSKQSAAFANTQSYLTYIPLSESVQHSFSMDCKVARAVSDILGSLDCTKTFVTVLNNRYCYMISGDEKIGLMLENVPVNRMTLSSIERYTSIEYNDYSLVFNREILTDTLVRALGAAKDENTVLSFKMEKEEFLSDYGVEAEESLVADLTRGDAISGYTHLTAQAEESSAAEGLSLFDLKLKLNLKLLTDIVGNCEDKFVMMNLQANGNNAFVQLIDCHLNEDGDIVASGYHYTTVEVVADKA